MSTYLSPYASLEIPCDVCTLRCEAKSLRQKTIDTNPSLDIAALEASFDDSDRDSGYGSSPTTPVLKSGTNKNPWGNISLAGPCPPNCAGIIKEAKDRDRAVEEAKAWLKLFSTEAQGRMPR